MHIVFIHGLFMNPRSWEHWKAYFESRGHTCHTPAYPFHDGEPAALRAHQDLALGGLTLRKVKESLAAFIRTLPEKPILIGHSMGGLLTQQLTGMEMAAAGVCLDSAPPQGIFSFEWSFLKCNFPVINPLKGNSVFHPTPEWFQQSFCNTMTLDETVKVCEQYVVPESRNIPRSSTGRDGKVDFRRPHTPLLFIAGEKDTIVPASLNRKNFEAYRDQNSRRDFKVFPGRTHYLCGQEGWEELAAYIEDWLTGLRLKG